MKLQEINKFVNRIQQHNPKWEYSEIQIDLLEDIKKNVDGNHLGNIIISKYMNQKSIPTVDQIKQVIFSMKNQETSGTSQGCEKCRNGFISVFSEKLWIYGQEEESENKEKLWSVDNLESIFMIPKTEISCFCHKANNVNSINNYLSKLGEQSFKNAEFFEISYIQLFLFYSHALNGSLKFDQFDPWSFWAVNAESRTDFVISDIINQRLKDMLTDVQNGGMGININQALIRAKRGLRQIQSSPFPKDKYVKKEIVEEEDEDDTI